MIHFLIGSDSAGKVHLHVVSTPDEVVPWRKGVYIESLREGELVLSADAELLGTGSSPIATISFIERRDLDPDRSLLAPSNPLGKKIPNSEKSHLGVTEAGTTVRVTFKMPLLNRGSNLHIADRTRVRLLVMTHTMGRAKMAVDILDCE
jgi:hypothetical protein